MPFFSYHGSFVKSSRKEEEEAEEVKKKGHERSVLSRSNKISFRMVLYRLPFSCPATIGGLVSHSNDSLAPPSFHRSIAFVPPASIHLVVRKKGRLNGLLWKRQTLKAAAFCVLYTGICRPLRFPVPCLSLRRRCLMFLLWIPRTRKTKRGKCQGSFVLRFFKFSQTNGNHSVFRLKRIIPLEISSFRRVPRIIQFVCFAILRFKDLLGLFFIFRDDTYRDIVFLSRLFFRKIAFLFVQF